MDIARLFNGAPPPGPSRAKVLTAVGGTSFWKESDGSFSFRPDRFELFDQTGKIIGSTVTYFAVHLVEIGGADNYLIIDYHIYNLSQQVKNGDIYPTINLFGPGNLELPNVYPWGVGRDHCYYPSGKMVHLNPKIGPFPSHPGSIFDIIDSFQVFVPEISGDVGIC